MIPKDYSAPRSAAEDDSGSWLFTWCPWRDEEQRVCEICGEHYTVTAFEVQSARREELFGLGYRCPGHRVRENVERYLLANDGVSFHDRAREEGIAFFSSDATASGSWSRRQS